jgi:hypothetical protein
MGLDRRSTLVVGVLGAFVAAGACSSPSPERPGGDDERYVVAAAGDIACASPPGSGPNVCRYDAVAELLSDGRVDAFLAVGDVQYEHGEAVNFREFYDEYFGPYLPITRPVPGDHEYETAGAAGYFDYFGSQAAPPGGYYSFDLGSWHVIALNSQQCFTNTGCDADSEQYRWLQADLESHSNDRYPCTLAFFHAPRFLWVEWYALDGEPRGPVEEVEPFWEALYAADVDVVVGGNAHNYQRWAPQDPQGQSDPEGIRQFVVGTGGKSLNGLGLDPRPKRLQAAQDTSFGVLELTLEEGGYAYEFRTAAGQPPFEDAGRDGCH